MPKAQADEKAAAFNAAAKRAAAKGIIRPKHIPNSVFDTQHLGVDSTPEDVIHSNSDANQDVDPRPPKEPTMSETTEPTKTKQEIAAEKAAAKIAAKEAKLKAAADAKAAKQAERERIAAEKAAKKEADAALKAAEKAARAAEKAETTDTDEKAASMLALRQRVAAGLYVKGKNGQMRSSDAVAVAMESVPAQAVVPFLIGFLGLDANPYAHLNYGQQSMNLRNRLRGALRGGKVTEADFLAAVAAVTPSPAEPSLELPEA